MADTLDVIDLDTALEAINMTGSGADHGVAIERFITSVSRALDALCGPIVARSVQQTFYLPNTTVILHDWVSWGMARNNAEQDVTALVEYQSGTGTTLTGETLTVSGDYLVVDGIIARRSGFSSISWKGPIAVTYTAGRYATTADVDPLFIDAAAKILAREWPQYASAWSRGAGVFDAPEGSLGFFRSVEPVVDQWLADERRPPSVA